MNKHYSQSPTVRRGNMSKFGILFIAIFLFSTGLSRAQEISETGSTKISLASEANLQRVHTSGRTISDLRLGNGDNPSSAMANCEKGAVSVSIDEVYGNLNTYSFADDFVVAPNEVFYMDEIEFIFLMDYDVEAENLFLDFYENANGGGPGAIYPVSLDNVQVNLENLGEYGTTIKDIILITVTFPTPVEFHGGVDGASFWAGTIITHNGGPNSAAAIGTNTMSGSQTFYVNPGSAWLKNTDAYANVAPQDLIAGFYGQCEEFLGTEENNALSGATLFPNPLMDDAFYVYAPKLNGEQVEVSITDMAGRTIFNQKLQGQDNKISVPVNGMLNTGIYSVQVKFEGEESTYRLVKQ